MRKIDFHPTDAKPEDLNIQVGVSDKFQDADLKAKIQEIIDTQAPKTDNTPREEEKPVDISSTLERIAGKSGAYAKVEISSLLPTPSEWNQFTDISMDKKILMAESIYYNGLLQPIVVRAINEANDQFQILAGNTRTSLYDMLYDITGDAKYLAIDAKIYWYNELTDEQAREIVTDTNYVQRASLSAKDRAFCIHNKIEMLKSRKESDIMSKVAEQMNIKRSTVFYWDKIAKLIPKFFDRFQDDLISLKAASRIASFPPDIQEELYNMQDRLTDEIIMKVPAKTVHDEIIPMFNEIIDALNAPKPSYALEAMWEEDGHLLLKTQEPPPADTEPILLYLPTNKLKVFLKSYEDYIVQKKTE